MNNTTLLPLLSAVNGFSEFADALNDLWSQFWGLLVGIGVTLLVAYGVLVAVIWIGAGGDENKKKQAKTKIIYYTTGIALIFVILVGVPMLVAGLSDWSGNYV